MRTRASLILLLLLPATGLFAAPRVSFVRTLPATHDLGSDRAAVIYAIGDNDKINDFVDDFVERTNRGDTLRIDNVVDHRQQFIGATPDRGALAALRHEHPAGTYLSVTAFTCSEEERGAEGNEHDVDGGRVRRRHVWIDAVCTARIDVMSGSDGRRLYSFPVRGEGTSPRVAELTKEEHDIARSEATRFAAISAAEAVIPRVVRESVELDETAPAFEEAMSMIDAERLDDARAMWEAALPRHRESAALRYDLAAVCEATGDRMAARKYYEEAARLQPTATRYTRALDAFRKRGAIPPKEHVGRP